MVNSGGGGAASAEEGKGQVVWDDEEDGVTYSYTFFHFMFLVATLFIMMTLTHWYRYVSLLVRRYHKVSMIQ